MDSLDLGGRQPCQNFECGEDFGFVKVIRHFEDESLDFVYIDGFHEFDYVMSDLIFWTPKVRPGGIVAGHDYYPFFRSGVIQAADTYTKMHNINTWYVTRERHSSFFWVK